MRIPDLNSSDTLLANLQWLNSRQADLSNQVSTGQRITRVSDDPSSAARVLEMQEEKERLQQYTRNGNRALEINQATYSAISDLKDISNRASELGVLGVGPAMAGASQSYATELNQLIEHGLERLNASYGGDHLFGGTQTASESFTATRDASGKITTVTYAGAANSAEFHLAEGAKVSPYTSATTNQQLGDFVNNLIALRDALSSGSPAAVQAAQPVLQSSEDHILGTVADLGAMQTRLEGSLSQHEARFSELEKLTSKETDADLSETVVKLTQAQTAYQAALQVGAQVLRVSLLDYLR